MTKFISVFRTISTRNPAELNSWSFSGCTATYTTYNGTRAGDERLAYPGHDFCQHPQLAWVKEEEDQGLQWERELDEVDMFCFGCPGIFGVQSGSGEGSLQRFDAIPERIPDR